MSETRTAVATQDDFGVDPVASAPLPVLIGHSPAFCRMRDHLQRVAADEGQVLVVGPPGAGRTLVARTLHDASGRMLEPFASVLCRDEPETLLEIELFGCAKGSVVGATADRHGALDLAHGGILVIEDIDHMPLRLQGLLAGFLASGDYRGVGALGPTLADVRIVATTSACLSELVASGRFREDLWGHLSAQVLSVPALRDRRDDVPVLADYFARLRRTELGLPGVTFSTAALRALMDFSWPGNVRELRAVVERLAMAVTGDEVGPEALPVGIRPRRVARVKLPPARPRSLGDELFVRLVARGESFWSCVYPLFMQREITRADVRELVRRGLDVARGNHETLIRLFNMPQSDQKKFDSFLKKYDCQLTS
jgi:DNA-binding NtrC family response regulator